MKKSTKKESLNYGQILNALHSLNRGDFSIRLSEEMPGEYGEIAVVFNDIVRKNIQINSEIKRVIEEVVVNGIFDERAIFQTLSGNWCEALISVNKLVESIAISLSNINNVIEAVSNGNLNTSIETELDGTRKKGISITTARITNKLISNLRNFTSEVIRITNEVGRQGKLGSQANINGLSGIWKDLTDNVNTMADNLTIQVRNIAEITTAVANGDLSKKIEVDASGELLELRNTVNTMVDQLNSFATEVTRVAKEVGSEGQLGGQAKASGASGIWKNLTDNVNELAANLTRQVRAIAEVATAVTKGDLSRSITTGAKGEIASLGNSINEMIANLRKTTKINEEQGWLKANLAKFVSMMQRQRELAKVAQMILSELAQLVNSQQGVFYIVANRTEDGTQNKFLKLLASYAFNERKHSAGCFEFGEGLVGQCAIEKQRILLSEVPGDYIQINSALGKATPLNIIVLPVIYEDELLAVIELASFTRFEGITLTFLDQLTESIAIVINTIGATMKTENLLGESQSMAEELQNQQEELRQTNQELEEKAQELHSQKLKMETKNREIEISKNHLERKTNELLLTSKYKSQFLANMSHELRTPLNSQMILSKLLADNESGNLDSKQIDYAKTIHSSGLELLSLINEILDLSKIESGTISIEFSNISLSEIRTWIISGFSQIAKQKQLDFSVNLDKQLPSEFKSDKKRVQQVLKNLVSNAFKFTETGSIKLNIALAQTGWSTTNKILNDAEHVIAFSVEDTGIGIHEEKLNLIFEAFQQANGQTSRKYGGTGLGLSISRELVALLGGEIHVSSEIGKGTKFTVYLPCKILPDDSSSGKESQTKEPFNLNKKSHALITNKIEDDRFSLKSGDKKILIIENDPEIINILLEKSREKGFKGIVTDLGLEVLTLTKEYLPDAIILNLELPDINGLIVLDQLKKSVEYRHIPVHIVSDYEANPTSLKMGAVSHIQKPLTLEKLSENFDVIENFTKKKVRNLLIIEDNEKQRKAITSLIGNEGINIFTAETGKKALEHINRNNFDCIVLDLMLPDISGFELIKKINSTKKNNHIPVIIYTGKKLTRKQETELKSLSKSIIIKDENAMERLLDETSLFLHRVVNDMPENKVNMLKNIQTKDHTLCNKKVLIVDDDIRNIFSLTALLEKKGMEVSYAENGKDGIEKLTSDPATDIVLMDIMMPNMDGFEAMKKIRLEENLKKIPIIALTAKAMKGNREECIAAGASDYISKPVDTNQLVSLLRVWLYK